MSDLLTFLGDLANQITTLSPELLTVAGIIVLGYVLKFIPRVPNKIIPAVCCFTSAIVYPLVTDRAKIAFDVRLPIMRQVLIGVVLWLVAWVLHEKVLKRFEAWLPGDFFKGPATPIPTNENPPKS